MLPGVQQRLRRCLCIAPGLVFLIVLCAGCGTYTYGQGGQSQTTPAPTATSSQQAGSHGQGGQPHSTPTSSPASPQQAQNCGTVDTALNGQPVDRNQARLAGNCFWQAFQHCRPATLVFITPSAGTALIRTFTIHNNQGTCSISDAKQLRMTANQLSAVKTFTCTGLVQQQGLLFLSCGEDGNVLVPG